MKLPKTLEELEKERRRIKGFAARNRKTKTELQALEREYSEKEPSHEIDEEFNRRWGIQAFSEKVAKVQIEELTKAINKLKKRTRKEAIEVGR